MIVTWPGNIEKSTVNETDLVSAIDIAPTILDITNLPVPESFEGKSFQQSLFNRNSEPNEYVFAQYDENAGGIPRPSRTIISQKYGYVFNPWATGDYKFISAATHQKTYKQMRRLSDSDENIKKRFEFWIHRTVEELYDYENDPNALNNLIDNPAYKEVVQQLREELHQHMKSTNDYVLRAFENKDDHSYLNSWMKEQLENAFERQKTIKWKRWKNKSGKTKNNKALYSVN